MCDPAMHDPAGTLELSLLPSREPDLNRHLATTEGYNRLSLLFHRLPPVGEPSACLCASADRAAEAAPRTHR